MTKRATLLEVWIEPKGVWAAIVRMLGYLPARRRGLVTNPPELQTAYQRAIEWSMRPLDGPK